MGRAYGLNLERSGKRINGARLAPSHRAAFLDFLTMSIGDFGAFSFVQVELFSFLQHSKYSKDGKKYCPLSFVKLDDRKVFP